MDIEMHLNDFYQVNNPGELELHIGKAAVIVPDWQVEEDKVALGRISNNPFRLQGALYVQSAIPAIVFDGKNYEIENSDFEYILWNDNMGVQVRFQRSQLLIPKNPSVENLIHQIYDEKCSGHMNTINHQYMPIIRP
jgi:hypothetical protein